LRIGPGARIWVPKFALGARVSQAGNVAGGHVRVLRWDSLPGYSRCTGITALPPLAPVRLLPADAGLPRPAPDPLATAPTPGRPAGPGQCRPRSVAEWRRAG
jgi:hypothetical protein